MLLVVLSLVTHEDLSWSQAYFPTRVIPALHYNTAGELQVGSPSLGILVKPNLKMFGV